MVISQNNIQLTKKFLPHIWIHLGAQKSNTPENLRTRFFDIIFKKVFPVDTKVAIALQHIRISVN